VDKITLFIDGHTFDKEFQGTHGFIRGLYAALSRKYSNIELYAGAQNTANLSKELPFIPASNILSYKKHASGFMRFIIDIPAHIKKYNFDFAHFQYTAPAAHHNCRYIVTLHDILFNDFREDFPLAYRLSRNIFFRKSFRKAAIKTTVSAYSRQRIARHYHIPAEKIDLIPNGPLADFGTGFTKQEATERISKKYGIKNYILYVSRIEPRKNQQLLLKKYLELELYKKGISLVLIGKQSINAVLFNQLMKSVNQEQSAFIHWLEQVPSEDIEAFYLASRLFAYPSKAEGFGLPPLEAALCKVPVLCSRATAMDDYSFFDPYRFDPSDENEFAYKLQSLLDTPPAPIQLDRIAANASETYSWERTADKFYQLLNREKNIEA
jgi:glycosyltransferase involved in cell wall biosynthesis